MRALTILQEIFWPAVIGLILGFALGCDLTPEEVGSVVGGSAHAIRDGSVAYLEDQSTSGLIAAAGVAVLGAWQSVASVLARKKRRQLEERNAASDFRKGAAEDRIAALERQIEELGKG